MAVLVTGAAGFVGLGIVRALAEIGFPVVGLDVRPAPPLADTYLEAYRERVTLLVGDVRDGAALRRLIAERRVDAAVHAGAITPSPEMEWERPGEVISVNIDGTVAVLEAAREARLRRVVYISSSRVYTVGDPAIPVAEDAPTRMDSLYAISKRACEALGERYADLCGLDAVSVRLGWIYGPTEHPTTARTVMSTVYQMVHRALRGEEILVDDLQCPRDWTHVADIGHGIAAVLQSNRLRTRVYNLSSGRNATAAEVLAELASLVPGLRYGQAPAAQASVRMRCENRRGPLSIARLAEDTGFSPRHSLASGLAQYVAWCRIVEGGSREGRG